MIVVKVELWSANTKQITELARMVISNIGGTAAYGDYECATYVGRSKIDLDASMNKHAKGQVTRIARVGKIERHPRLREHVWNLVTKALKGMNYGG